MNKRELTGTAQVFSFTLRQFCKSRANLVSLLVLLLFVLASMPLVTYVQGSAAAGEETVTSGLARVAIDDQTDLVLTADALRADPYWADTVFAFGADAEADAAAVITGGAAGYTISVTGSGDEEALCVLESALCGLVDQARLAASGLTDPQRAILYADYAVVTPNIGEAAPDVPEELYAGGEAMDGFWVQYGYAIVVMMLCLLSSGYVIRAVVEEKSSKLVELLLISVRPMALLLGKILGAMVYVLVVLLVMVAGWAASLGLTAAIFGGASVAQLTEALTAMLPTLQPDVLHAVGLGLVLLVSLLLGYLTMSLIGGLCGACCSSIEDMGSASGTVTMVTMAGYLASCVFAALPGKGTAVFSALCPVLSMFCAPVQYAQGNLPLWVLLLSWLIQLAVICALAWLAGRVYADLIIHRGSRIRLKQLVRMARMGKEAAR